VLSLYYWASFEGFNLNGKTQSRRNPLQKSLELRKVTGKKGKGCKVRSVRKSVDRMLGSGFGVEGRTAEVTAEVLAGGPREHRKLGRKAVR
jgi:hypothetical protein